MSLSAALAFALAPTTSSLPVGEIDAQLAFERAVMSASKQSAILEDDGVDPKLKFSRFDTGDDEPTTFQVRHRLYGSLSGGPRIVPQAIDTGPGPVSINAGRNTNLITGGADDGLPESNAAIGLRPSNETDLYGAGLVEAGEAEFQVYDVNVRWDTIGGGPIEIGLATGVRAIRADVSDSLLGHTDGGRFQPIPVVGADLRWNMNKRAYISGAALTNAIADSGDVVDLKAEAGISFTPKVGVAVGYQIIRSAVDAGPFNARLDQEGPFARLRIQF